jgi:hypothetical protein
LQLCADRRYHRKTMDAFEAATSLASSDGYWIEASAGGAATFRSATLTARYAYEQGARVMGWAAHGDACGGFPGRSDEEIEKKLRGIVGERLKDFPEAEHWLLFGHGGRVEATLLS